MKIVKVGRIESLTPDDARAEILKLSGVQVAGWCVNGDPSKPASSYTMVMIRFANGLIVDLPLSAVRRMVPE